MKNVLVILTQANLAHLQVNESLAASMVLATFGLDVKILLQDAALSLLKSDLQFDQFKHAFKVAANMVDSFEFYDLTPVYVEQQQQNNYWVQTTQQEIELIQLNAAFVQQFDHVLYW